MNAGTLVLGALNGLTIGLLAAGLVLVYKSSRFLNLAHGQLGTLAALLLAKLVLDAGWNWWLAFVVAVGTGVLTGLAVERALVGPLQRRTRSPLRLMLLSLGVSQVLLALTFVPALSPDTSRTTVYPQPFGGEARIAGVTLSAMNVLTAVLAPLLVVALALFLRHSVHGKQIRAAANNPDAARLCGIPVRRVNALAWAMAGGMAAVSAVLQAPNQASFNVASLGPYLLMLTLGAAAFGAFVSLPGALVGGLVLGVIGQVVAAETQSAAAAELAIFATTLLLVFLRGRAIARVFDVTGAIVEDLPVARIPPSARDRAVVRHLPLGLGLVAFVALAAWPQLPYFSTTGRQFLVTLILVYALLGVALTMLVGWGGQLSLGHFALVGLGAYLTARWAPHWSVTALLVVTAGIGAAVMVLVGLPALRVRGLTLAVTTLGLAVISHDWLYHQSWVGGANPLARTVAAPVIGQGLGRAGSQLAVYRLALVVLALTVLMAAALRRSGPGRLVVAVRDNERASAAFGVSPAAVKLAILAVSGALSAVAGVLWAFANGAVSTTQFTPDVSLAVLAIPVIGGLGSINGAVAAAAVVYGLTFFVGPHVAGLFGTLGQNLGFNLFLAGSGIVATVIKFPHGLAGAAQAWWQRYLDAQEERSRAGRAAADFSVPLRVRGVRVAFGGVVALDEPDIIVRQGEIVGLIGTNGAGKTTLMNVISGALTPEKGSVLLFGTEVVDLAPDLRAALGLARSFQDATLFPGLTVRETIQVALAQRHKVGVLSAMVAAPWARLSERRVRRAADDIIGRFGLERWADTRTAELSTGTRRICDLAAQVATRPKLLLLDEPTAGVAQREAEAFGPLLRRIRDDLDCSVLIVEHDMPLLMGLCDRVYALEAGRVIAEGTPEEVRANPRVVASYLGSDDVAIARSGAAPAGGDRSPVTTR